MAAAIVNGVNELQRNPLKLYIQDIFRATRTEQNKYIYEIFGLKFKNVMLHGVVTAVYNTNASKTATNFDLTDPTGCVSVYYDSTKNNLNIPLPSYKKLIQDFADASRRGDEHTMVMGRLINGIEKTKTSPIFFSTGDCISVVGDIFIEDLKNTRMISAYECRLTSMERDLVWLEELRYLYEKFYLWKNE
ncbi:uncharacterized protein LOC133531133 [Cydia pomonella]|uniref:uncharacterized protein LOC133531133 n=1 Tax=Cydia pomonella TaxID=82600 RepID=UPI002ADDA533|nr:uncharacterized protein LOC133531133 [Cydia pomonella]